VFDYDYTDIAAFVGRKEAACRQLFSRARKHLADNQRRFTAPAEMQRRLLISYIQAVQQGDQAALIDLLSEDARLVADGGGKIPGAATHPILGRQAVAQFSLGASARFLPPVYQVELYEVNHQPAILVLAEGRVLAVFTIEVEEGRVQTVQFMANPDKLGRL
jgi:RNA polymerase sigma-70 factor (ECF subfamily)